MLPDPVRLGHGLPHARYCEACKRVSVTLVEGGETAWPSGHRVLLCERCRVAEILGQRHEYSRARIMFPPRL
jgi:hypothetical protein